MSHVWPTSCDPYERELTTTEFQERLGVLLSDVEERRSTDELIAWFCRRYPTPAARLDYARRKYRQLRTSPIRVDRR